MTSITCLVILMISDGKINWQVQEQLTGELVRSNDVNVLVDFSHNKWKYETKLLTDLSKPIILDRKCCI